MQPQRKLALSLSQLSISEFTNKDRNVVGSHNVGVVELMILHTCDKCIFSKSKWILSMDMVAAASKHLNINAEATMEEEVNLILETDDGTQFSKVKNLTRFDSSIVDIERQLLRQVSIFSQLLWRYGLMPELIEKFPEKPSATNYSTQLDWKMHSFTHIRALLVDIFAGRTTTITLTTPGSSALTGGRASEIRKSNSGVYPTQHSRTPSLETLTGVLKSVSSNFGSRNSDVQRRHTKAASLHHSSSKANSTQTSSTQITLALPDSANASSSSNSVTSSHQINNSKPAKQTSLFNRHGLNVTVGASHHFGGGGILTASSPFVPTPLTHEGLLKNQK